MERKYELTEEIKKVRSVEGENGIAVLHRIRALKDFGDVKKGDLGGFIEKDANLSHEGDCWVYNEAKVLNNATVYENAKIMGNSTVRYMANIYGNATLRENSVVRGAAKIYGNAVIRECSVVSDAAEIYGNAILRGMTKVRGFNSFIFGNARLYGNTILKDNAYVSSVDDVLVVGPIGKVISITFYKTTSSNDINDIAVACKRIKHKMCITQGFQDINAFEDWIRELPTNEKRMQQHIDTIEYAKAIFKSR